MSVVKPARALPAERRTGILTESMEMVSKMNLVTFLRDEEGQITVDWTVLVASLMAVGLIVGAEVVRGVDKVTDEYDGINTGQGLMTMFVSSPEAVITTAATTPDETSDPADDAQACNAANPGNNKCVGNAGETPNGDEDGWGDGSSGQGDVHNGHGGDHHNGKDNNDDEDDGDDHGDDHGDDDD